jgi:hypothetical protein
LTPSLSLGREDADHQNRVAGDQEQTEGQAVPKAVRSRRRRWDAGQVAVTERDVTTLAWLGEMFGTDDQVLAEVLGGVSPRRVRGWVDRMARAGLLTRHRILGRIWATPTAAGLRLAGLPYPRWQFGGDSDTEEPSGWVLTHVGTVARLRLHLEAAYPEARWISERSIRKRWDKTGARVRIADGGVGWPDGTATGVEVELHLKAGAVRDRDGREVRPSRYRRIVEDTDRRWTEGVWWYTPPGLVQALERRLAEVDARGHVVHPLPEGMAP